MGQPDAAPLIAWSTFYEVVGSSAGALTGLQFVVMTLISQVQTKGGMREIRAFGSPTVVHFCAALLIAAVMSAPWPALLNISVCLAVCGAVGAMYSLTVLGHARKANYKPDGEDWFWYAALPLLAYTTLITAAVLLSWFAVAPLFVIAGTSLLFLFIGIHNSWDTVTYIAVQRWERTEQRDAENSHN